MIPDKIELFHQNNLIFSIYTRFLQFTVGTVGSVGSTSERSPINHPKRHFYCQNKRLNVSCIVFHLVILTVHSVFHTFNQSQLYCGHCGQFIEKDYTHSKKPHVYINRISVPQCRFPSATRYAGSLTIVPFSYCKTSKLHG